LPTAYRETQQIVRNTKSDIRTDIDQNP